MSPKPTHTDPGPLMDLATSYWRSQALFAALDLGVFAGLADGALDAATLAAAIDAPVRPTRLLLNALAALGLLEVHGDQYANDPAAATFLVPGSPAYLGEALLYARDVYPAWNELPRAVREDAPVIESGDYLGNDPVRTRHFVRGMHARALGIGQALVTMLDLTGRRRMLDVGGGPGTYSALLTGRNPTLHSKLLELPLIAVIATEILAEMGAGDRVTPIPGSYHDTPFPADNDVVLISGVLHREPEPAARALITRAATALAPGGLLVVSDVFTDTGGASPAFATLFGLNMLLSAPGGGVYPDVEVASWMQAAGLENTEIRPFPPPMPHRVITAARPAAR